MFADSFSYKTFYYEANTRVRERGRERKKGGDKREGDGVTGGDRSGATAWNRFLT